MRSIKFWLLVVHILNCIKEKFLNEILEMYAEGEISAGKAAEMLGIPRAAFYELLAEKRVPLPEKLNQSILKELKKLETKKD
jgi:predicted HTH domain antitoxin